MTAVLRVGILGTGRMAHAFAAALGETDKATLIAVGSRSDDSAKRFAGKFGNCRAHAGYNNLAADPEVDLVYISSPHSLHSEHSLLCLEAGKAVLCEKPFAINAKQASNVIDQARENGVFLMEAMWTRFIPAVVRLRELLASGSIGTPGLMVAGGAFVPQYDPEFYLFRPELGGGVMLDAGVYLLSMASMVFGTPAQILATGTIGEYGVDDHDAVLLHHANGEISSLHVSLKAKSSPDVTIYGDRGQIHMQPPLFAPTRLTLSANGGESESIDLPFKGNGYQFQVEEVARCMAEGLTESPVMPLDETFQIMQTMDEVRRQIGLRYPMES